MRNEGSDPRQENSGKGVGGAVPPNLLAHKDAESALQAVEEYAEAIVQTMPDALLVLDTDLRVKFANDAFYTTFQVQPAQTEGSLVYELGNGQWNLPELRVLLEAILPDNKVFTGYTIDHDFEQIGRRVMLLNGRRLDHLQLILLIIADITETSRMEAALGISEERLRLTLASINDYAIISQDERWHIRKDGTRFWASGVRTPLQADARSGYVKVARDLTERWQAEERLESQVRQRTAQVRALVTQLTMSEQEERRRVSGILHDDLQQRLFSLMFQLVQLRQALDESQEEVARQLIGEMEEALQTSVRITRELSVDLSPPVLHDEGLVAAVQWLATQMHRQQGLEVEVQAEPGLPLIGEDLRVLLFHSIRELLFNIVKHAGVNTAIVTLGAAGDQLRLEVADRGRGLGAAAGQSGPTSQGLRRIEQRMELLGGGVDIVSIAGQGTQITLHVPLGPRRGKQV